MVVSFASVAPECPRILTDFWSPKSCREELRKRYVKAETALFRVRYDGDDGKERDEFLKSMKFDWAKVCQGVSLRDPSLNQHR